MQALIAIGGKAKRIRASGVRVPISKSFIPVRDKPLLYWSLISLHFAGVREVVLCGDDAIQLREAELMLSGMDVTFARVEFFQDPGLGVHGLPYQVVSRKPEWLTEKFVFECGHSLMEPGHYGLIVQNKTDDNIVFSAFRPHPSNSRQPVRIDRNGVSLLRRSRRGCYALAHPMVVDLDYAWQLPALGFDVGQVIGHYAKRSKLAYAFSGMPPEFDVIQEMIASLPRYEEYLETQGFTSG
jgi:hypothetical protein